MDRAERHNGISPNRSWTDTWKTYTGTAQGQMHRTERHNGISPNRSWTDTWKTYTGTTQGQMHRTVDTTVFHQTNHGQTHLMKTYTGTAHGHMHRTGRHNSTPPDRSRTDTSYGKIYGYSTKQLIERQLLQIETLAFSQTVCGQNNRTERHTGTLPNS